MSSGRTPVMSRKMIDQAITLHIRPALGEHADLFDLNDIAEWNFEVTERGDLAQRRPVVEWLIHQGFAGASAVATTFVGAGWDTWGDPHRQRLLPYLARLEQPGHSEGHAAMALQWLAHDWAPTWLRDAGLDAEADRVLALGPLTDLGDLDHLEQARRVLARARKIAEDRAGWDDAGLPGVRPGVDRDPTTVARYVAAARVAAAAHGCVLSILDTRRDLRREPRRTYYRPPVASCVAEARRETGGAVARTISLVESELEERSDTTGHTLTPQIEAMRESALDLLDRMIDSNNADGRGSL